MKPQLLSIFLSTTLLLSLLTPALSIYSRQVTYKKFISATDVDSMENYNIIELKWSDTNLSTLADEASAVAPAYFTRSITTTTLDVHSYKSNGDTALHSRYDDYLFGYDGFHPKLHYVAWTDDPTLTCTATNTITITFKVKYYTCLASATAAYAGLSGKAAYRARMTIASVAEQANTGSTIAGVVIPTDGWAKLITGDVTVLDDCVA
mmetsp:Transcript_31779/g.33005  ORF Transcript_31779/g.33005 Transcript_31779/m.33005 type:complete len:207 (-) Transcript_31779:81-701(-)